ncbi:MAG TPA: hypothetical protein VE074_09130 [Jatrophihabitantaceae bacterium]|nr:hypothetical protein [Jatrophihabitantaceae bacterium]
MQIIEVSVTGVRSAALHVRRRGTPLRFTLFPMVHVGLPTFYEDVAARLRSVDLIVAEGIQGESESTAAIMKAFQQATKGRGAALVVQHIDYDTLGPEVLCPDMTGADLERALREQVPLLNRLLLRAGSPIAGLAIRFLGPEVVMNSYLAVDDLPTARQELFDEPDALDKVIVHDRDALVAKALAEIYEQHQSDDMHVAVVYGAEHVPGIFRYLHAAFGYRVISADWLNVYNF